MPFFRSIHCSKPSIQQYLSSLIKLESFSIGEDGARDAVEICVSLRLPGDGSDSSSRGDLVVYVVDKVTIFTLRKTRTPIAPKWFPSNQAGMLMAM
jgi:hypothetical protein